MGVRQSKRSVDITTTPKKEGLPVEGVVGDAAAPGDGKLEKIEETDAKPTTNGVAPHTDATAAVVAAVAATPDDKDKDKDEATEKEAEKEDETKAEEAKVESPTTETPVEAAAEVTTPTEGTPASPTTATSPDSKETKKKDKLKKKWSFRSISFGKKDKSKPAREDAPKNGDVTKEEPLAEGGEEAETAEAAAAAPAATEAAAAVSSPAEEKSSASSPTTDKEESADSVKTSPETAAKPEEKKSPTKAAAATPTSATSSPSEEKKDEDATAASNSAAPVEANNTEDNAKQVEHAIADNNVEVSQVKPVVDDAPVEVKPLSKHNANQAAAATAPSIIERKTSEDIPSRFPSSPPPTPIDPSPLQRAQQVAASATALAEALKVPAEVADADAASETASDRAIPEDTAKSPADTTSLPLIPKSLEMPENPDASGVSHEQTGNAMSSSSSSSSSPQPIIVAPVDTLDETTLVSEKTSEDPPPRGSPTEIAIPTDTKESEESPIPVTSNDIIVEAKPALVLPDNPTEDADDERIVRVLPEAENVTVAPVDSAITDEICEDTNAPDVPPPLPESPIPLPKSTSQLLNFMTTQIESATMTEIIDDPTNLAVLARQVPSAPPTIESLPINTREVKKETEASPECEIHEETSLERVSSCENDVCSSTNVDPEESATSPVTPAASVVPRISTESATSLMLTPPRSPNSDDDDADVAKLAETGESGSLVELREEDSNRQFKMESLEHSLNSYNDSELELKERLAESMEDCDNVNHSQDRAQSKTETEAPVENNVAANDVSTTEVNDEAPMSPPPAVPTEVPAPTLAPAITEDVASVTKAIEEIDINEKAVAAAVNENIESVNTNEIIADMNHQNNMNE